MYKGFELVILDIGDTGERLRPLWRHYYKGTQGFIYVVNSVETCRIDEAREVLNEHFLEKIEMPNPILHIYPNKQDLPNSHPPSEIGELLQLNAIQGLIWKVQGASAKTGDGVFEGLDWLIEQVKIRGIYDI
ncbi:ADP-ribosylation factor [Histomonas meleagridis]|uniref:ADP-ribosylation factor n=1 Tax=Histomonas meleagridis TaxID=135588 RepID=UPI00355A4DDC|nr:ADP-ribosylation factor [Histomonas meleagridis]KAH0796093.1 ADP-ribosylation factor [Histomonas meleagridis]